MTRAAQAIKTGAVVAQQLQPTGQDLVEPAKRAGRRLPSCVAPTRVTRGGRAKAKEASRLEAEAKLELEAREEELAQEAQETGPKGSRMLGERGAEVQEWGSDGETGSGSTGEKEGGKWLLVHRWRGGR